MQIHLMPASNLEDRLAAVRALNGCGDLAGVGPKLLQHCHVECLLQGNLTTVEACGLVRSFLEPLGVQRPLDALPSRGVAVLPRATRRIHTGSGKCAFGGLGGPIVCFRTMFAILTGTKPRARRALKGNPKRIMLCTKIIILCIKSLLYPGPRLIKQKNHGHLGISKTYSGFRKRC